MWEDVSFEWKIRWVIHQFKSTKRVKQTLRDNNEIAWVSCVIRSRYNGTSPRILSSGTRYPSESGAGNPAPVLPATISHCCLTHLLFVGRPGHVIKTARHATHTLEDATSRLALHFWSPDGLSNGSRITYEADCSWSLDLPRIASLC